MDKNLKCMSVPIINDNYNYIDLFYVPNKERYLFFYDSYMQQQVIWPSDNSLTSKAEWLCTNNET